MKEKQQGGHVKEAVDGARDSGEFGTAVLPVLQTNREEKIGFHRGTIVLALAFKKNRLAIRRGALDFFVGELKEKVNGLPLADERRFSVEGAIGCKAGNKGFGSVGF